MSVEEHKREARWDVRCKIITISDTRSMETDKSGQLMKEKMIAVGHEVAAYEIVKDERNAIYQAVQKGIQDPEINIVLTNGGTGIAKRDVTIETVQRLFDKELVGFGELFRMLSYTEDIGAAAMLSRAVAGVAGDTAIFSTPGSSGAVILAMDRLIVPELPHIVRELKKDM
ncbi:MogA/MoaB family molybdenum cofactor biosynthesis protein [Aquibacillus sp. 3ASR75-11]|uniref:Molybdenum cofactor biosynthesis protein B n=1 Tax=Terrihalobacillus insolitus TaxID=2950438 RepID=A0A9X3WQF7_9BACI|nr:MogA/MoaB family molybdenum cofactor biosynthesis protein [Terrihalobacillus insolitus]MDC3412657.1 MogA/MoaB family molybdenum cofactor biosynthesis protein [Terrihalobacillus insolitus]MDC3424007.1 MogA/MoaB family molybdenum cofactor biosynthesis protein [Terrihalobacillus insolitus]